MLVSNTFCVYKLQFTKGFSLIEMMIVVTILGILGAVGAPAFNTWTADTKTRTVAEALQNGIRVAQTEAVRRGVQVQFILTDDSPNAIGVTASTTGKNWVAQSMTRADATVADEFIQGAALGAVSTTSLVSSAPSILTFNSLGRLVSPTNTATFVLANPLGTRNLNVTVTIAGKIRMCDPNKSISTNPDGCA